MTKKPPFIHPASKEFFSLKYFTELREILITPNRAGGLTAVKVTNLFLFK